MPSGRHPIYLRVSLFCQIHIMPITDPEPRQETHTGMQVHKRLRQAIFKSHFNVTNVTAAHKQGGAGIPKQ